MRFLPNNPRARGIASVGGPGRPIAIMRQSHYFLTREPLAGFEADVRPATGFGFGLSSSGGNHSAANAFEDPAPGPLENHHLHSPGSQARALPRQWCSTAS
jgi:hypothetical protein